MPGPLSFNPIQTMDRNASVQGDVAMDYDSTPADRGFVAWNYDPVIAGFAAVGSTPALLKSSIYTHKIKVPTSQTSTTVTFLMSALDSLCTAATVALFNDAGTKVAETADIHTSLTSGNGVKFPSWATPVALTPGFYHVAIRYTTTNATGTLKLCGTIPAIAGIDVGNMGDSSASKYHYATSGTNGSQASIPSSITMSARVANLSSYSWFAI